MNRIVLLALILVALIVGGLFFLGGTGSVAPTTPGADGGDGGTAAELTGERTDAGSDPRSASEGGRLEVDGSIVGGQGEPLEYRRALSGLKGRLVWDRSGDPIGGVEVGIGELWLDAIVPELSQVAGLAELRSPIVFRATTTTAPDGSFLLKGLHSRAALVLLIGLKTDKAAFRVVDRSPNRGELLDLGDVRLRERGTVKGRVVDDAGKPVAGARVRVLDIPDIAFQFGAEHVDPLGMVLWVQGPYRVVLQFPKWLRQLDELMPFGDGRTGADGRFTIPGVRPGRPTMVVTKPDFGPLQRPVDVVSESETDVGTLSMGEGEYISGQFVDGSGKPVTGVTVAAGGANGIVPVSFVKRPRTVDDKGKFEIAGLPRTSLYLVYRRKPGIPYEVSGPHASGAEVKIVLDELATGTVSVFESGGRPYEGPVHFSVCVADESAFMPGFEQMIPGDRHFLRDPERPHEWNVRDLPVGIYRVVAQAEGYALTAAVLDLSKASKRRSAKLTLVKSPTVRFETVDESGEPVAAARVYWNATKRRDERKRKDFMRLPVLLGKTDANGVLETTSVPRSAKTFYARHPAHALAAQRDIVDGRVRFVLGKNGSVSGVVAEDGSAPSESFTVVAAPTGTTRRSFAGVLLPKFAQTDPDGAFWFEDLQPGTWRLQVIPSLADVGSPAEMRRIALSARSRSGRVNIEVQSESKQFVRLELKPEETAAGSGSVVGTVMVNSKPAVGATVQTWAGRNRAKVGAGGTFELTGLKDGEQWIGIEMPGGTGFLPNRLWEGRVTIVDGSQENLQVFVEMTEVTLTVVDDAGKPVEGLPVEVVGRARVTNGHRGRTRMGAMTNAMGRVSFAVPSGEYTARSSMQRRPRSVVAETPVAAFGPSVRAQLTASSPVTVAGTVHWDETGFEGAALELVRRSRPNYIVLESDGRFVWGPITGKDGGYRFTMRSGSPGEYVMQKKGALQWSSDPLRVPVGGSNTARLVLRPNADLVKKRVAGQQQASQKGQKK